uniref:ORF12 n=1 Tax=Physarum polycephalum TaxID=5791 RepID=Q9MJ70_PHYPO|nr:hypothetical protein PhpooMp13 [Physarum polycephalum]BAB08092.1 unnamed protein product [Physarum polycephalum]
MYKNKTYEEFCTLFCETYKIKTKSDKIFKWLWNKENNPDDLLEQTGAFAVRIGSYLIEYLIKHNIFKESSTAGSNNPRSLSLNEKYEDSITTSNLFVKPILYPEMSYEFESKIERKSFSFKLLKKQEQAKIPKFTYKKTSKLNTILNTNDVKYCINKPFFNFYIDYLKEIEQILLLN